MAEYYALLSRAVTRLQPNNETARREVYTKARNALIQQLKAISPPLQPAEISKQRLELEEAIRKVEREAAVPASAGAASEAEISRSAARAMEEALGPMVDAVPPPPPEPPRPVASPIIRPAPQPEPAYRPEPAMQRAPIAPPTPAEVRSRAVPVEPAEEEAFSVVSPTPMPPPQPRPTVSRASQRAAAAPARAAGQWEDRATASAFSEAQAADLADGRGGGRRGRKAEKQSRRDRDREKPRRSVFSRLLLFILILLVLAGGAYTAYVYREPLVDFFASLTGDDEPADVADTTLDAGGTPAADATDVRIVGPQPADAAVGAVNPGGAPAAEVVPEIIPTQAILYEDVGDGNLPAYEGTITWAFVNDAEGPRVDVRITIPERSMEIVLSIQKAPETATNVSHTIDAIVTVPTDFPGGGVQAIAQLAAKSSEDAVGTAIVAQSLSVPPDYFLLELAAANERQNMSQMRQDWFDLGFVYANGQQAIVTFNKGTEGREVMTEALAAWGE